jgi:hypothetical protein
MKVVIDTSSLLSLVRYYLPFDKNSVLFNFIKAKIEKGEIIIIDKVLEECSYTSQGLVIQTLSYLADRSFLKRSKQPFKTDSLIAPSPAKFLRQVDHQFVNTVVLKQRKLTDVEYENQKNHFMIDADMKQILLCLNLTKNDIFEEVIIVSEESESSNDNKLFKKIPAICKELDIKTLTLPQLLKNFDGIDFEIK